MSVLVFKAGGNTEHFPDAETFGVGVDGKLYVLVSQDDDPDTAALGIFAQGGWLGARRDHKGGAHVSTNLPKAPTTSNAGR